MSLEEIWARKSDDEILAAAERLSEYTQTGQRVIREEAKRRELLIDEKDDPHADQFIGT